MLATDLVGIVSSCGDVEHQLQCEPRHRAVCMPLAVLLDLHLAPRLMTAGLGWAGGLDADSRIGLAIALLDGERDQVSERLHPDLLHDRRLACERVGDVLALDGGKAVLTIAVTTRRHALAEVVEDRTPRCLCRLGQSLEEIVLQIFDDQRVDAARLDLRCADVRGCILALRQ
jgi:hypothetical protein